MASSEVPAPDAASHQTKIDDFKKRRGPVSCAECRRLKLKCDRRVPCSSCTKRGCAPICPNGTLTAGPGNRFVLADTQHLHSKIEQMSKRIAELEDALASLQLRFSNEAHPLLKEELMLIKAPLVTHSVDAAINDVPEVVADSLGTLTLGDHEHFFGPHAAADYLSGNDSPRDASGSRASLPSDLKVMARNFPLYYVPGHTDSSDEMQHRLSAYLPQRQDALSLVDLYFTNAAWSFAVVTRQEVEDILASLYLGDTPDARQVQAHELTVIIMIFAIACLVDPGRLPSSTDATSYYDLARVALGIDPVIEHPSLSAIRAIHMMTLFLQMYDQENGATMCFILSGLNSQLCQSLGLHRDDSQWNLSEDELQKRRSVFWQVLSLDTWASFAFGRPACFTSSQVDAKLPVDVECRQSSDGSSHPSFHALAHSFEKDCMLKIMEEALGTAPQTYAAVLRFDRLVREHPFSQCLRQPNVGEIESNISPSLMLQRTTAFCLCQKVLLILHRGFFVQALTESPSDPLKSKYRQSVLAAFQCAFNITASVRALFSQVPLALRFWSFASWCFSASVFLSALVVRSPGSGLGQTAWVELERVRQLFKQCEPVSRRISRLMTKLETCHAKARTAHEAHKSGLFTRHGPEELCSMDLGYLLGRTLCINPTALPCAIATEIMGTGTSSRCDYNSTFPPLPPVATSSFLPRRQDNIQMPAAGNTGWSVSGHVPPAPIPINAMFPVDLGSAMTVADVNLDFMNDLIQRSDS